jgi:hypothetical protein
MVLLAQVCFLEVVRSFKELSGLASFTGRTAFGNGAVFAASSRCFELQEWLGHATPTATQHYAKITPTKLAKSYADAGYFTRNLCAIEVFILLTSHGSSTISGTATARTISSISARIAWPVRSARFIYQRTRRKRSYSKPRQTCCAYARIFRWPIRNSLLMNSCLRNWPTYRRRRDLRHGN